MTSINERLRVASVDAVPRRRQLLVDVSVIARHDAGTGIQRVVRSVLDELVTLDLPGVIVRAVAATAQEPYRIVSRSLTGLDGPDEPLVVGFGDAFLGLDLSASLVHRHESQLAGWRRDGALIHFVVYDMLPIEHPEWFRYRTRRNFRRWLGVVERQAHQVLCISSDTARAFARRRARWRLGRRRAIDVATVPLSGEVHLGPQILPSESVEHPVLRWMATRPTILMVGTVEPRKGYDQAITAFERLWQINPFGAPALLIAGRPGWKTQRLQAKLRRLSSPEGLFQWLDNVDDSLLEALYGAAAGLLFASRGEGFGLPVAEAHARGLPVLARDLPVLREHLDGCARYFAGDKAEVLATAIADWSARGFRVPERACSDARRWATVAAEMVASIWPGEFSAFSGSREVIEQSALETAAARGHGPHRINGARP